MSAELFAGETGPVALDPVLRGVDLAVDWLVARDCFTERTLRILDELRTEVAANPTVACAACRAGRCCTAHTRHVSPHRGCILR